METVIWGVAGFCVLLLVMAAVYVVGLSRAKGDAKYILARPKYIFYPIEMGDGFEWVEDVLGRLGKYNVSHDREADSLARRLEKLL